MEKDQNQVSKIAKECARDYSKLKNSGVDATALPPRQWIRAWMQSHYNIIKLSGYFFREMKKALDPRQTMNEGASNLGLNNKVKKKFDNIDAIDNLGDFADLGLPSGNLWRIHNEGAENPEDKGNGYTYFQAEKNDFKIGEIPTTRDYEELYINCVFKIDFEKKGLIVTSKTNKNSIFFPATGYIGKVGDYENPGEGKYACYWQIPGDDKHLVNKGSGRAMMFSCDPLSNNNDVNLYNVNSSTMLYPVRTLVRPANESNLGLNNKVKKAYSKKSVEDAIDEMFVIDDIDKMLNCLKTLVNDFDAVFKKVEKIDNVEKPNSNEYYRLVSDYSSNLFLYRQYETDTNRPQNYIGVFTYDDGLDKYLKERHPEWLICDRDVIGGANVFGNAKGNRETLPMAVLAEVAEWYNSGMATIKSNDRKKAAIDLLENSSLGLNKKVTKAFSKAEPNLACTTNKTLYLKILRILKENGFYEDKNPYEVESSGLKVPTNYFTYTCKEYEDSITYSSSGKHATYSFYQIFVFIEKNPDPKDLDQEKLILEIQINPHIDDDDNPQSNLVWIGTDRYDNVGWIGRRLDTRFVSKTDKYADEGIILKNSTAFEGNIGSLDNRDNSHEGLVADIEGIISTIAGFQHDQKNGNRLPMNLKEETFDVYVVQYLSKYIQKNTRTVTKYLKEGLADRVKKEFKEKHTDENAVNVLGYGFNCKDELGNEVNVIPSDVEWKNQIFKWLYENVPTLTIKEDNEYREKRDRTVVKVDDFITDKYGGGIHICVFHREYSSWGPPSYVSDLDGYFNGSESHPLILSAHNLGNYSICPVYLWRQGSKWRLTSNAYYQDLIFKSKRRPNGAWRKAKRTVNGKDCPILLKVDEYLSKK